MQVHLHALAKIRRALEALDSVLGVRLVDHVQDLVQVLEAVRLVLRVPSAHGLMYVGMGVGGVEGEGKWW